MGEPSESLIRSDRVHGRLYVDPRIYEEEIARIWSRVWVYVGHDSEVREVGDYVRKSIGPEPLIMVRDREHQVRLLVNRCVHRGNTVCHADRGNATAFRCAYHGWTYDCNGDLLGVPYRSGFDEAALEEMSGLHRIPRMATYRGFVFGSLAEEGISLEEHLAGAREALDRFVDFAPAGEIELTAGSHWLLYQGNWKLWIENAIDNYHQNFVHQAAFWFDSTRRKIAKSVSADESPALVRALGNGHVELDFRPVHRAVGRHHRTGTADEDHERAEREYAKTLEDRLGAERATGLLTDGPPHLFVFPNMMVLQQDVRMIGPVGPLETHVHMFPAFLKGASREINLMRLRRHENAYGPAGAVMPDDLEIFERTQSALRGGEGEWLRLLRGFHRESLDDAGFPVSHITDELGMRAIWAEYARLMSGAESLDAALV
jgi:fatty-acyl-CoA synthase